MATGLITQFTNLEVHELLMQFLTTQNVMRMKGVDASVDKHTHKKKELDQSWLNWRRTRKPRQNPSGNDEEDEESQDEKRQEAEVEAEAEANED
ncbi:MAG: hypothetical protein Q9187_004235 [Circinaria calcarea]